MKKKRRFPASAIVANAILCLVCCFCVLPVLLLVISSFTDNDTAVSYTHLDVYKRQS